MSQSCFEYKNLFISSFLECDLSSVRRICKTTMSDLPERAFCSACLINCLPLMETDQSSGHRSARFSRDTGSCTQQPASRWIRSERLCKDVTWPATSRHLHTAYDVTMAAAPLPVVLKRLVLGWGWWRRWRRCLDLDWRYAAPRFFRGGSEVWGNNGVIAQCSPLSIVFSRLPTDWPVLQV